MTAMQFLLLISKELEEYLASPQAVIDGSQKRYNHSLELLLKSIENNTKTLTHPASFSLTNDGASWKLQDDGQVIGAGIFGTLSSTPVEEELSRKKTLRRILIPPAKIFLKKIDLL
ncbi:MAG: hypothetical protein ACLTX6_10730 [Lachnospiraceae bacterium]